ncbi:EAL domain-containing protein [Propionivibrio dicarboxylicus]|uniref:EAL domain-containing protein n=1 Tax=Propionivibrio dicarboxylicus TaxID=83767 RepID=A0A1G7YB77_9RHOO|nr:EAL domain-containing protein [Propionivibrio dicarboxylicus]
MGSGIIETIAQLGQALKLSVIAEGVETAQQLATLKTLGCNEAQGYPISRPLEAEAFERFLAERPGRKLQ